MSIAFDEPGPHLSPVSPAALGQMAALCWRLKKGRVEVLMVTSRETRRWVIPKGWPMAGLAPEEVAAREAWEEAGALGKVSGDPLGRFVYDKVLNDRSVRSCCVTVYPLRQREVKARWPERKERRRKWFGAEEAAGLVAEAGLAELLVALAQDPGLLAPAARHRKGLKA
ncbi:NUDIX hydrolase [Stagnihabitans tardus]|uniref:NUDIX domain-containing protein n=1 Tax=Stagnihabitans tardus TaxID=2699202 RepID=A0AAE5BRU9_9RHOB|nr:NUDIX hydrolase [Stagnihabitans tardus]NBZ87005.1 NUDIX domain-containing protein [Stagnihabitans tardus]